MSVLDEACFPDPEYFGRRRTKVTNSEYLIKFIAVLSVKLKMKTYVLDKMAVPATVFGANMQHVIATSSLTG